MALGVRRWTRDGHVENIHVVGADTEDYDHMDVVVIPTQRHDASRRFLDAGSTTLREATATERSQKAARETVDETLVDGPNVRA